MLLPAGIRPLSPLQRRWGGAGVRERDLCASYSLSPAPVTPQQSLCGGERDQTKSNDEKELREDAVRECRAGLRRS